MLDPCRLAAPCLARLHDALCPIWSAAPLQKAGNVSPEELCRVSTKFQDLSECLHQLSLCRCLQGPSVARLYLKGLIGRRWTALLQDGISGKYAKLAWQAESFCGQPIGWDSLP